MDKPARGRGCSTTRQLGRRWCVRLTSTAPRQLGQPGMGNGLKHGISHQLPCVCTPPPACNLAGYAQTAPRGNPRAGRFVVPETLTKHSVETAQRGQSGSCSSSWGGQKVSPKNYRSSRQKEGTALPATACSDSTSLRVLFLPTRRSEVERCVCISLTGCLVVKVHRRCVLQYLWCLHGPYFFHGRSSGSPAFGVPENLKIKPFQTDKDEGREAVLLHPHSGEYDDVPLFSSLRFRGDKTAEPYLSLLQCSSKKPDGPNFYK